MALTYQSSATGGANATTVVISKPSGTVSGDLLEAILTDWQGGGVTVTAPTGWTAISGATGNDGANNNLGRHHFYLVAGGSEPASYTFTQTVSGQIAGEIRRYSGQGTTVHDGSGNFKSAENTASPSTSAYTTTVSGDMLLVGFGAASYAGPSTKSYTTPTGFANATTVNDGTNNQTSQMCCDAIQATHGTEAAQSTTPSPALSGTWAVCGSVVAIEAAAGGAVDPYPADFPLYRLFPGLWT